MAHLRSKKQIIDPLSDQADLTQIITTVNLLIKLMNEINHDYYPYPIPEGLEENTDIYIHE